MPKPFRWSIEKREQLGGLLAEWTDQKPLDLGYLPDLRTTAARIIAMADTADLAFIGRTPENFFDYLSGIFQDVKGAPGLRLIQISLSAIGSAVRSIPAHKRASLFAYFEEEKIDPLSVATADRPLALVDYVSSGGSMGAFIELLKSQADNQGADWNVVQSRLRIIGLLERTKTSPNTWRWQQHQDWLHLIPDAVIKNVSVERFYLYYLANMQPKTTRGYHIKRWDAEGEGAEPPTKQQREALAIATSLFDLGCTSEERLNLAAEIAKTRQSRL